MKRAMLLLAAQLLCCFLVSLGVFLLKPLGLLHRIAVWGLLPTVAAISAFGLDTHRLNPYLCWFMPPLAMVLAAVITSMGYLPDGAAVLLDIFFGILGAAAGETYQSTRKTKRK